jgi:hypothetical protein
VGSGPSVGKQWSGGLRLVEVEWVEFSARVQAKCCALLCLCLLDPSGEIVLALFEMIEFEISLPQCPTHYSPVGNGDVLDILDSDHLPVVFQILDHVKIRNLSEPVRSSRMGVFVKSLASELISPRVHTSWRV